MSSSLLEQAIIDADELKEAALKNAESSILEKYAVEVKEAVDSLLEQDEEEDMLGDMGDSEDREEVVDQLSLAAVDDEKLCPCPEEEEEVVLDLDQISALAGIESGEGESAIELDDDEDMLNLSEESLHEVLEEMLTGDQDEIDADDDGKITAKDFELLRKGKKDEQNEETIRMPDMEEDEIKGMEGPFQFRSGAILYWDPREGKYYNRGKDMYLTDEEAEELVMEEDEVDVSEEDLTDILEELIVDMEPVPHGKNFHARPTESEAEHNLDVAIAREQDTAVAEELEELRKAVEKLEEQNKTLKLQKNKLAEDYKSLKGVAREALTKLDEVNFANAKLIYTNRTLKSDSLNERQKTKLVEAISKVDSVEEAKIVFETLSSNISARKETGPKNLSEAVSKNNGLILKSNNESKPANSNQVDRLKRLAGII